EAEAVLGDLGVRIVAVVDGQRGVARVVAVAGARDPVLVQLDEAQRDAARGHGGNVDEEGAVDDAVEVDLRSGGRRRGLGARGAGGQDGGENGEGEGGHAIP